MPVRIWWPLFVLSFVIVLTCLVIMMKRLKQSKTTTRFEWIIASLALFFYLLTAPLGQYLSLHRPVSHIAELFILHNAIYFFFKGRRDIFWLNVIALVSIAADFSLHHILK